MASVSAGMINAISYAPVATFVTDDTTHFRMLPMSLNNAHDIDFQAAAIVPSEASYTACAYDTFDSKTLQLQTYRSKHPQCWPSE